MMHISLDDLDPFHSTTHLDLEAIFGGHISGRRLRGVKINPIFHDQDSSSEEVGHTPLESEQSGQADVTQQTAQADVNQQTAQADGLQTLTSPFHIDVPVYIDIYESLPRPGQHARLLRHQSTCQSSEPRPLLLELDHSTVHSLPRMSYVYSRSRKASFTYLAQNMRQNDASQDQTGHLESQAGSDGCTSVVSLNVVQCSGDPNRVTSYSQSTGSGECFADPNRVASYSQSTGSGECSGDPNRVTSYSQSAGSGECSGNPNRVTSYSQSTGSGECSGDPNRVTSYSQSAGSGECSGDPNRVTSYSQSAGSGECSGDPNRVTSYSQSTGSGECSGDPNRVTSYSQSAGSGECSGDPNRVTSYSQSTGSGERMADDDCYHLQTISEAKEDYQRTNMCSALNMCSLVENSASLEARAGEISEVQVGNNSSEHIPCKEDEHPGETTETRTKESIDVQVDNEHIHSSDRSPIILDRHLRREDISEAGAETKCCTPQDVESVHRSDSLVELVHEDDVRENVLLYSSDADSSPTGNLTAAPNQIYITDNQSDWPDMDELALPCDDNVTTDVIGHPDSEIADCYFKSEDDGNENCGVISNDSDSTSNSTRTSATKPLKPILHSVVSGEDSDAPPCVDKPEVSLGELKTVTFADGTVFNEDKAKRYQKERIDLRELYRDRICGRPGFGLVNPVFVISDGGEAVGEGLTDDEKVKRNSFRISLVNAAPSILNSSSQNSECSSPTDHTSLSDLNTPSYMKKYLSQSTQVTRSQEREAEESIVRVEDQESHADDDIIQEAPDTHTPQRTPAQQRRFKILQGIVLVMVAIVITTAIGLGILFTRRQADAQIQ